MTLIAPPDVHRQVLPPRPMSLVSEHLLLKDGVAAKSECPSLANSADKEDS
jgi:hypothetical protein